MENQVKPQINHQFVFSQVDTTRQIELPDWTESTSRAKANSARATYVNYGKDNKFPSLLVDLVRKSPTLSSIINGTIEMIKSAGFTIDPGDNMTYWPYMNKEHETLEDFVAELVHDYRIFGCFCINVIYNRLGKIAELYVIPMEFVRFNEDRTKVWFSRKFGAYTSTGDMKEYDVFDGKAPEDKTHDGFKSQMYIYTNSGHRQCYGISPQTGCLSDLISEALAADYIKNTLASGLAARHIISLPNTGNLTDDQRKAIEKGIKDKFTGVDNSGAFMLWFDDGTSVIDVHKIDADNPHEIYNAIRDAARTNIFIANQATPNLFGSPTATTGFNDQEYASAFLLYDRMVLNPMKKIITRTFYDILGTAAFWTVDSPSKINYQ